MRKVQRLSAGVLFGLAFAMLFLGLVLRLGEARELDPLCPGGTHYTIWGFANACTQTNWNSAAGASDIMNQTGVILVIAAAMVLTACALSFFGWPREALFIGLGGFLAFVTTIGLFSTGLLRYTSRDLPGLPQGLGVEWGWAYYVLMLAVPVLYAACLMAFMASRPIPAPPLDPARKANFIVPPKGIRAPKQRPMRILPDYTPTPRAEPEGTLEEEAPDEAEPDPHWKTRLRGERPSSGKFKF